MHRLIFAIAGLLVLAMSGPAVARGGGEAGELQAARLNALAGGPLSERDKELLERLGVRERNAQLPSSNPRETLLSCTSANAPSLIPQRALPKPPLLLPTTTCSWSAAMAKDYAGLLLDGMAGTLSPRVLRWGDLSATSSGN
jgi:hypothetical protein